jgi:hypothetical protein
MALWHRQNATIRNVQGAFRSVELISCEKCIASLGRIIDEKLWQAYRTRDGIPFESLPQWVAYPQPNGLGVCDQKTAEFLRKMLLDSGRQSTWALILEYISAKPGRPKLVDDEGFRSFIALAPQAML